MTPRITQGPSTWGLSNYLPNRPITEDEASVQKHVIWLQRENKKKEGHDMVQVDLLMALTLHQRRDLVVNEQKDVETIISRYPWLKSTDEVKSF